jgi:glycogenin
MLSKELIQMKTYLTIITRDDYLLGVQVLHKSLMMTDPRYDLLVILTRNVSTVCKRTLDRSGIKTLTINRDFAVAKETRAINARSGLDHWNETFNKLLVFELTQYEKIVFLDSDMMVLQNLDHLFERPHMSAVAADRLTDGHEHWIALNSGLMVVEPESGLAASIMSHVSALEEKKESFGDQSLLHEHYPDWPEHSELHLDQRYNVFFSSVGSYVRRHRYNVNWKFPDGKTIAVVHFIGPKKPWKLSSGRQLSSALKKSAKCDFASAKVLFQYFLICSSVRNGQTRFGKRVFSWLINFFGIRGARVESGLGASKCCL